jgi:hypothetical protein
MVIVRKIQYLEVASPSIVGNVIRTQTWIVWKFNKLVSDFKRKNKGSRAVNGFLKKLKR